MSIRGFRGLGSGEWRWPGFRRLRASDGVECADAGGVGRVGIAIVACRPVADGGEAGHYFTGLDKKRPIRASVVSQPGLMRRFWRSTISSGFLPCAIIRRHSRVERADLLYEVGPGR